MAKIKPVFIGCVDGKEYYRSGDQIVYRIPDDREAVQAPPGWSLIGADFSQIEIKLMAFLSQDQALKDAINKGVNYHGVLVGRDFHTNNLAQLYPELFEPHVDDSRFTTLFDSGEDPEDTNYKIAKAILDSADTDSPHESLQEAKDSRSGVKVVSFGVPYGAAAPTIALQIRKKDKNNPNWPGGREPLEQAKVRAESVIKRFFSKYSRLEQWITEQGNMALVYHYTRSAKGRMRWYPEVDSKDPNYQKLVSQIKRWAGNQPIQSSNADILKTALRRIYCRLREGGKMNGRNLYGGARIMLVVHDEIVMCSPNQYVTEVAAIMKEEMEAAYNSIALDFGNGNIQYLDYTRGGILNKIDVTKPSVHWVH